MIKTKTAAISKGTKWQRGKGLSRGGINRRRRASREEGEEEEEEKKKEDDEGNSQADAADGQARQNNTNTLQPYRLVVRA